MFDEQSSIVVCFLKGKDVDGSGDVCFSEICFEEFF